MDYFDTFYICTKQCVEIHKHMSTEIYIKSRDESKEQHETDSGDRGVKQTHKFITIRSANIMRKKRSMANPLSAND